MSLKLVSPTTVTKTTTLTVGDLRKALAGFPDNMPVSLEISEPGEDTDLAQAFLRSAHVEARCDEVDRFYLWGSCEDDVEEYEAAEKCANCGSPYHRTCPDA